MHPSLGGSVASGSPYVFELAPGICYDCGGFALPSTMIRPVTGR